MWDGDRPIDILAQDRFGHANIAHHLVMMLKNRTSAENLVVRMEGERGAQVGPEPQDCSGLLAALTPGVTCYSDAQQRFDFVVRESPVDARGFLLATVSQLLSHYPGKKTPDSVVKFLGFSPDQAKIWLESGDLDGVEYCPGRVNP